MITHFPASVKTAFQKISVVFESLGAAHGSAIPCAAPQSLCLWSSRTLCAYLTPRRRIVFILALLRSLSALQVYNGFCRMSRRSVHISSFGRLMYRDCPIGKKVSLPRSIHALSDIDCPALVEGDAPQDAAQIYARVQMHFAIVGDVRAVCLCAFARIEDDFVSVRQVPDGRMPEQHAFALLGQDFFVFEAAVVDELFARRL